MRAGDIPRRDAALVAIAVVATVAVFSAPAHAGVVPEWAILHAEKALIDKVGEPFFRENFVFAPDESMYEPGSPDCGHGTEPDHRPRYDLRWRLRVADRPFVDEIAQVVVGQDGEVLSGPHGVPNCIASPSLCTFSVDEIDALRIAREAHLDVGIRPWTTSFHFFAGELQRFVWTVSTRVSEGADGTASGRVAVIDASSGTLVRIDNWSEMP